MIIWLASYPRSGNTLLRTLLNIAFGQRSYSRYNDPEDLSKSDPRVRDAVGHEIYSGDWATASRRMAESPEIHFVKTHEIPEDDGRAIYIARDGRAAAVSFRHYLEKYYQPAIRFTLTDIVSGFAPFGSWGEHLSAWQPDRRPDTLLLRYEDILRSPQQAIDRIAGFCGIAQSGAWANDFERLRRLEPAFFREGTIDGWRRDLDDEDEALFWFLHGDWMRRLGYATTDEQGNPSVARLRSYLARKGREYLGYRHSLLDAQERGSRLDRAVQRTKAAERGGAPAPSADGNAPDDRSGATSPAALARGVDELLLRGEALFHEGQGEAALDLFEGVSRLRDLVARATGNAAVIRWEAGDRQTALEHLRSAHALEPGDRAIALNLAEAACAVQSEPEALAVIERYLREQPADPEAGRLRDRLLEQANRSARGSDPADRHAWAPGAASGELAPGARAGGIDVRPTLPASEFSRYSYSRRSHFRELSMPPFHRDNDSRNCDLKVYQDTLVYNFLLSNVPPGARLLEVGGGDSRVLRALAGSYECWNLDKFEGCGNGLTRAVDIPGVRLVKDYIGNFNPDLPGDYFDVVFSISTLEHVPEDEAVFDRIARDIRRVLKRGGYSLHCFDVVDRPGGVWTNGLLPFLQRVERTAWPTTSLDEAAADPDLWVLSKEFYERNWRPTTRKSYEEFGRPFSSHVLWTRPRAEP